MSILIDGYNLLHATDIFVAPGDDSFRRLRRALLDFLASRIPANQLARTTVVFDAKFAPRGAPRRFRYRSIQVCFASGFPDADAMIAQLLESERSPKEMLVVSSDHQVQNAARRRGAGSIDSDQWLRELESRTVESDDPPAKPEPQLDDAAIAEWLEAFSEDAPQDRATDDQRASIEPIFPPGYAEELLEEDEPPSDSS